MTAPTHLWLISVAVVVDIGLMLLGGWLAFGNTQVGVGNKAEARETLGVVLFVLGGLLIIGTLGFIALRLTSF